MNFFFQVYAVVQKVPVGKVTTYGDIAKALGTRDARRVGHALHSNPNNSEVPCHRVVSKEGKLSESYAFGGSREQHAKLLQEGVTFISSTQVNLTSHHFVPS
jgi:methylated-DNA-protein-cysteine methyltransferase related protein